MQKGNSPTAARRLDGFWERRIGCLMVFRFKRRRMQPVFFTRPAPAWLAAQSTDY
jgi:hypothetical protein